jgi:uncharacterized protein
MILDVTGVYAAALTVLYLFLTARVIIFRRVNRVSLGDGNDEELLRRMRAHGNFAEYVPLGLLLMGIAEVQGSQTWLLHVVGLMLLAGRLMHGLNFTFALKSMPLRTVGMMLTLTALGLGAVLALPI